MRYASSAIIIGLYVGHTSYDFRDEYEKVIHSNDAFAPVGYLKLKKMHLVKKTVSLRFDSQLFYTFHIPFVFQSNH